MQHLSGGNSAVKANQDLVALQHVAANYESTYGWQLVKAKHRCVVDGFNIYQGEDILLILSKTGQLQMLCFTSSGNVHYAKNAVSAAHCIGLTNSGNLGSNAPQQTASLARNGVWVRHYIYTIKEADDCIALTQAEKIQAHRAVTLSPQHRYNVLGPVGYRAEECEGKPIDNSMFLYHQQINGNLGADATVATSFMDPTYSVYTVAGSLLGGIALGIAIGSVIANHHNKK